MFRRNARRVRAQSSISQRVILRVERLEFRATPAAITPAQIRHAYGFDQIVFNAGGQSIVGDGRNQTIAIVDAYRDPSAASDADTFAQAYSINGGSLSLYSQYGPASQWLSVATPQGLPQTNSGWSQEIALDIEWAHAIAPGAHILLVEAKSSSLNDLLGAVDYARRIPTVAAVSMSWGANEFRTETSYDGYFTTPAGHTGVAFVGASGDNGAPGIWPAVSANVIAVGGTTLQVNGAGNYLGETAWSASGGGVSQYVGLPNYQVGIMNGTARGAPDVAYDANPNTGFPVYSAGRWLTFGGTSAGAPQWAALMAIVDQGRAMKGVAALDGRSALSMIYNLPASDFHDITSGSNGYSTHVGYDLVTGRGTPVANRLVNDLAGFANTTVALRQAGTGVTASGTTNGGFRFSFGPSFFGTAAIAKTQPDNLALDTSRVSSMATFAGQPAIILMTQPIASSSNSSDVAFARRIAHSYGTGVARLDWRETNDDVEGELELDLI